MAGYVQRSKWRSVRFPRRRFLIGSTAVSAGWFAAACGGSSNKNKQAAPASSQTQAAAGTATAKASFGATPAAKQAKQGGSLIIRTPSDPPNFSPFTASVYAATFANLCYNRLIQVKSDPSIDPADLVLEPDLAQAMPETPDSTTYIFKIKPGIAFHNLPPANGRQMTVEDIKAAIDAYRSDPRSAQRADYTPISSVETPDSTTVVVKTAQPYVPLLSLSAGHYGWRIFPKEMLEGDDLKTRPVGTGAYVFQDYQASSKATYKRNQVYFKQGLPYINDITIVIIPQDASAISAFLSGQVDVITQVDCTNAASIKQQKKDARYQQTFDIFPGGYIAVDTSHPPFNDVRVRRALSLAFNRKAEIDALECGEGKPDQLIPSGAVKDILPIDQLGDAAKYWQYDPPQAKQLLADAGLSSGFDVTLVYTPQYGQPYQNSAERALADFAAVGIRAKTQAVQYNQWIGSIYRPPFNFQGILWGPSRYYTDVDPYVWYWLHPDPSQGISNQSRVNDPNLLPLLEKQRQLFDRQQRMQVIGQIQKIVADQQYYIGRTTGDAYTFWQPWIQNWVATLGYDFPMLERAWDSRV
jgi:peptide/nickel transport system substrate-binding protein